jgi:hypothetical protein
MKTFAKKYAEASSQWPQTLEEKLSRNDWGSWVDWARPAPGHAARPSWFDREGFTPFSGIDEIDFGVRSH